MAESPPTDMEDRLQHIWNQQVQFMRLLCEKRGFPSFPVDITSKSGQKFLKGVAHDCMDELFEAIQHLKNGKDHRVTEVPDIDRDKYVEELVDALHFFFEVAIASGVTLDELYGAYITKGETNVRRIASGY